MRGSVRWGVFFDVDKKRERLAELEEQISAADFWSDPEIAQRALKERSDLAGQIDRLAGIEKRISDAGALLDLCEEENEETILAELFAEVEKLESSIRQAELSRMLSGKHDSANAIIEINSGAGGTEAQDWGEMLLRMYLRWAERRGFKTELLSVHAGEGAGIKNATLFVEGANAFGFLRSERGVHRLVRISPFDANARRHTSFASVGVMPDIEQDIEIEVNEDELRIDTYRSSGAGGQHVNKTDSAVRITHLPTGIVAACQADRSQHKNKASAMRLLKAKLYERELERKRDEMEKLAGEKRKIDFGSQIRSYVLQPYQLIKDLRTNAETGNVQAVLDGSIDHFIESYLMSEDYNQPDI